MKKTIGLGLTTLAFLIGLMAGAVDSRTTHLVVAPAQARPIEGVGGSGGCDGHGAAKQCLMCNGVSCNPVCVGMPVCTTSYAGGHQSCIGSSQKCASGGSVLNPGGGVVVAD